MAIKSLGWIVIVLMLGCGQQDQSQTSLLGHFERFGQSQLSQFSHQQAAVPEYAPTKGVVVAQPLLAAFDQAKLVKELLASDVDEVWITGPSSFYGGFKHRSMKKLRRLIGRDSRIRFVTATSPGPMTVWARDWAPIFASSKEGELRLIDFNYYARRHADDHVPQRLAKSMGQTRISLPVYNEGGNFMIDGQGHCLLSERIVEANQQLKTSDDRQLSQDELADFFIEYLGCRKVRILPRLPFEPTGHIDIWTKFIADQTLLVHKIDRSLMPLYKNPDHQQKAIEVADFLDEAADSFGKLGYRVVRSLMPLPVFYQGSTLFRSYTNHLLVNGRALIPRFVKPSKGTYSYPDKEHLKRFEDDITAVLTEYGYQPVFLDSDDLIPLNGAIHCATMQVPRLINN